MLALNWKAVRAAFGFSVHGNHTTTEISTAC